jgi:hypothetical protein
MFRRILTALLIVGYVASQMAALPHAHAAEPAGHGGRAHVHGDWLTRLAGNNTPSHSHHHAKGAGHHHGHSRSQGNSTPAPEPAAPFEPAHDDDCVYLPELATGLNQVRPADELCQLGDSIAYIDEAAASAESFRLGVARRHLPPYKLVGHCALYLTLRILRI